MITILTGTTNYAFPRMDFLVNRLLKQTREKIYYQSATSNLESSEQLNVFPEMSFNHLVELLKKSKIIITHGGPGSVYLAIKFGKSKPFVLPRLSKWKEHVNDHQRFFCWHLMQEKQIILISPKSKIKTATKKRKSVKESKDFSFLLEKTILSLS